MKQKLNEKIHFSSRPLWRLSIVFVLFVSLTHCTGSKDQKNSKTPDEAGPKASQDLQKNSSSISQKNRLSKEDPQQKLMRALDEADQIHREVIAVLLKDRPPLQKSFFGKALRGLQQNAKQSLKGKSAFRCDTYNVTLKKPGLGEYPFELQIFHKCPGQESMEAFSEVYVESARKFRGRFDSRPLSEVVGIASGILNRRFNCDFELKDSGLLQSLRCDLVLHDKNPEEVYEFKKYVYSADKESLISLEGKLLKNLVPQRDVKMTVPLLGKIKVQERELLPPDPLATGPGSEAALVDGEKKSSTSTESESTPPSGERVTPVNAEFVSRPGENLVDPDIQKSRGQTSAAPGSAVRLHPNSGPNGPWVDEQGYPLTPEQIQEITEQKKKNSAGGSENEKSQNPEENNFPSYFEEEPQGLQNNPENGSENNPEGSSEGVEVSPEEGRGSEENSNPFER